MHFTASVYSDDDAARQASFVHALHAPAELESNKALKRVKTRDGIGNYLSYLSSGGFWNDVILKTVAVWQAARGAVDMGFLCSDEALRMDDDFLDVEQLYAQQA